MKNWLSIPEIANEYGLSRQTIWRLVREKKVASHRIGRQYRISHIDWLTYLDRRNQKTDRLKRRKPPGSATSPDGRKE
jgi:excisionase family DNA binding protein